MNHFSLKAIRTSILIKKEKPNGRYDKNWFRLLFLAQYNSKFNRSDSTLHRTQKLINQYKNLTSNFTYSYRDNNQKYMEK